MEIKILLFCRKIAFFLIGCAFFCLTGCNSVNPPASSYRSWTPDGFEKSLIARADERVLINHFDVDLSDPLTLADVIDIALRHSPVTREAWAEARAAYAQVRQEESVYYPSLSVGGDASRRKQSSDTRSLGYDVLSYGPSADVSWLLIDAGGRRAAVAEAEYNLVARNLLFNSAAQKVMLEAERSYYELHGAIAAQEAAEADVKDAEIALNAARKKLEAGLAVRLDVLQAQSSYENALYSLAEAMSSVKAARGALAKVLSLSADTDFKIEEELGEPSLELSEDDVSRLIAEALSRRPDVVAMRMSLMAQEQAVHKASSRLWPSITAKGSVGRAWSTSYDDNPPQSYDYQYAGYIGVSWPVFDGFYNLNVKRAALALAESAREKLRDAELSAGTEVWTKYHAFKADVQKLKYSESFLASAASSYTLAQESYNAGLKSIIDLLHAQSQLSSARSKLVQSRKDLHIALAELAYATGSLGCSDKE